MEQKLYDTCAVCGHRPTLKVSDHAANCRDIHFVSKKFSNVYAVPLIVQFNIKPTEHGTGILIYPDRFSIFIPIIEYFGHKNVEVFPHSNTSNGQIL